MIHHILLTIEKWSVMRGTRSLRSNTSHGPDRKDFDTNGHPLVRQQRVSTRRRHQEAGTTCVEAESMIK